ncbi:sulfatase-like hydrolase/transferase [Formosa sp. PL04]|uniref:sulfatase-like hydrolase/transferase n=1 Tax=Formosa sp. PL04 TaxID=3081755 RepID=UPI002981F2CF|nr:sulfatase-like hydrolase/transferase [Formosa sp. PL04]MDW5288057.1 sulfatase-like hydrolase/transferase [Formosa sp. PL04]
MMKNIKNGFMLRLTTALLVCLSVNCQAQKSKTKGETKPNIIVILADDLGYSDVGFNGSKDILTPELDKLATAGTVFSSAYVAHPFCGPSRAGLLTGKYPHEFGSQFNLPANSEKTVGEGIPLNETFISKALQESGYFTGAIGKWHLGAVEAYHPNKRGFDEFYGFLGGGHNYFPEEYRAKYDQQAAAGNDNIWDYLTPLEHNGVKVKETEYLTDAFSREASRFVTKAAKKDQPFFLYLAYNAPHTPLEAKPEDEKLFANIKDEKRRTYAAMVYAVDRGVGELIKTLKKTGTYENTLIIFLSDNGGRPDQGANNSPLKGRKGDTYEGGFRVPMFFHWPNHVPEGMQFDSPVTSLDFYPTFLGLANATVPEGKQLDGIDIWEDFVVDENPRKGEMIFAMRHRSGYSDVGVRQDEWKATKAYNQEWKLYNINEDISEEHDLSKENPEQLEEMVLGAQTWSKMHNEPRWFDPENLSEVWENDKMGEFLTTFDIN